MKKAQAKKKERENMIDTRWAWQEHAFAPSQKCENANTRQLFARHEERKKKEIVAHLTPE